MFISTCRFFSSSGLVSCLSSQESAQGGSPHYGEPRTSPTQNNPLSTQTNDNDGPDVLSVGTPSPSSSPDSTPPSSASRGLRLFHWSGRSTLTEQLKNSTPGLAALQQFQYKKEMFSSPVKNHRPSGDTSPPLQSSTDRKPEDKDDLPDSPPSQDSAYFSQSQPHLTYHKEEIPTYSPPSSYKEDAASVRLYKSPWPL